MNLFETTALGNFLSYWPDDENLTFEEVLNLLEDDDERIGIWEPFENHPIYEVVKLIENMHDDLKRNFIEKPKETHIKKEDN